MDNQYLRLFLGISPPDYVLEGIRIYRQLFDSSDALGWVPDKNLHITVYFFGKVAVEQLGNLQALIQLALTEAKPLRLQFQRYTLAPHPEVSRMIWARYQKSIEFRTLVQRLHELYQQISPELQIRKSPIPHITLARFKASSQAPKPQLPLRPKNKLDFETEELILWESIAGPEQTLYKAIRSFPLFP